MLINKFFNKIKSILGLSLSLGKANFKLRNEGSYLGIFWYLLDPLLMFCILLILQPHLMGGKTPVSYPIYLLIGLLSFNFFTKDTTTASRIIESQSGFVKSLKINLESLVIAGTIQSVLSHIFEILILAGFMVFFKIPLQNLIFYPLIFIFFLLFVSGMSFILATLGVYISDLTNLWSVLTRLLWLSTPVFYSIKPATNIFTFNTFNPLFYFITAIRDVILYSKMPEPWIILGVVGFGVGFFIIGLLVFERYKKNFAEMV